MSQRLNQLVQWYESLSPDSLSRLSQYYAPEAYFKDPFNEVRGQAAIQRIFEHMFQRLEQPRFCVHQRIAQGPQAFLSWSFHFRRGGQDWVIQGGSHLLFDAAGRVAQHRDYWDAAEELYEKLPVLGFLLRRIKQMVRS